MLLSGWDKSVSILKETIKNTEKDKVVNFLNKNVQSNKSLAKEKKLYSWRKFVLRWSGFT